MPGGLQDAGLLAGADGRDLEGRQRHLASGGLAVEAMGGGGLVLVVAYSF